MEGSSIALVLSSLLSTISWLPLLAAWGRRLSPSSASRELPTISPPAMAWKNLATTVTVAVKLTVVESVSVASAMIDWRWKDTQGDPGINCGLRPNNLVKGLLITKKADAMLLTSLETSLRLEEAPAPKRCRWMGQRAPRRIETSLTAEGGNCCFGEDVSSSSSWRDAVEDLLALDFLRTCRFWAMSAVCCC